MKILLKCALKKFLAFVRYDISGHVKLSKVAAQLATKLQESNISFEEKKQHCKVRGMLIRVLSLVARI